MFDIIFDIEKLFTIDFGGEAKFNLRKMQRDDNASR